jgi:hypothetical protein
MKTEKAPSRMRRLTINAIWKWLGQLIDYEVVETCNELDMRLDSLLDQRLLFTQTLKRLNVLLESPDDSFVAAILRSQTLEQFYCTTKRLLRYTTYEVAGHLKADEYRRLWPQQNQDAAALTNQDMVYETSPQFSDTIDHAYPIAVTHLTARLADAH